MYLEPCIVQQPLSCIRLLENLSGVRQFCRASAQHRHGPLMYVFVCVAKVWAALDIDHFSETQSNPEFSQPISPRKSLSDQTQPIVDTRLFNNRQVYKSNEN